MSSNHTVAKRALVTEESFQQKLRNSTAGETTRDPQINFKVQVFCCRYDGLTIEAFLNFEVDLVGLLFGDELSDDVSSY